VVLPSKTPRPNCTPSLTLLLFVAPALSRESPGDSPRVLREGPAPLTLASDQQTVSNSPLLLTSFITRNDSEIRYLMPAYNKAHSQIESVGAQHAVPAVTPACSIRRHILRTRNRGISVTSSPSTNAGHSMLCPYGKTGGECGTGESVAEECRNIENAPGMPRRDIAAV
jgi:hypothetical protein